MSQNDYHLKDGGGELLPGLGADEPSEEAKQGVKAASIEAYNKMKEELVLAGAELNEKERELIAKEEAQVQKERELEAATAALARREKALADAEAKAAAGAPKK